MAVTPCKRDLIERAARLTNGSFRRSDPASGMAALAAQRSSPCSTSNVRVARTAPGTRQSRKSPALPNGKRRHHPCPHRLSREGPSQREGKRQATLLSFECGHGSVPDQHSNLSHIPLACSAQSSNVALLPVKAGKRGLVTSFMHARSQFHWGRVACAHVQPVTVKAHAPVHSRLLTSGFWPSPREDIGATNEAKSDKMAERWGAPAGVSCAQPVSATNNGYCTGDDRLERQATGQTARTIRQADAGRGRQTGHHGRR